MNRSSHELLRGVAQLLLIAIAVVSGFFVVVEVGAGYLIRGTMEQAGEECFSVRGLPEDANFVSLEVEGFPPDRVCVFERQGRTIEFSEPAFSGIVYGLLAVCVTAAGLLAHLRRRRARNFLT